MLRKFCVPGACEERIKHQACIAHIYIHIYTYTCIHIHICIYICVYTHTHTHMLIYLHMHMHMYTYIYTYIYIYIYMRRVQGVAQNIRQGSFRLSHELRRFTQTVACMCKKAQMHAHKYMYTCPLSHTPCQVDLYTELL